MRRIVRIGILLAAISAAPGPAVAQAYRTSCPPPLKEAAGACVRECPAGYEDRGRFCAFRSLGR
ncbi:hypothetical protein [Methylobacterium nodulans]|uniref:Uncharacterized protein n=1 Tax=Methylobacterium nodulans (strain LMG 21967 / CNCM I-2342 / ORS 2060) TaxID=460265 RepID=B8IEN9_METNO|nr:hypothetical protein [Methylobacterium nodulans]ACL61382.1 conserved hypothetical protein [Methylobacterium nodulans ORS 2060]